MKSIGIWISIVSNILVLGLLIWMISGGFFKVINKFVLQPMYERWTTQFEITGVKPNDTVFLGDSITEGGKWHELFPHSSVRNRGIFGDFTTGVLSRMNQITDGKPSQVFLMIGINDLSLGIHNQNIIDNILSIIEKIKTESPQTEIFVQSVLPGEKKYQEKIESLNKLLRKTIEEKATWIDLYPLFLNEAKTGISDKLSNDKLHLLGQGYVVWRDAIVHLVNKK